MVFTYNVAPEAKQITVSDKWCSRKMKFYLKLKPKCVSLLIARYVYFSGPSTKISHYFQYGCFTSCDF